MSTPFTDVYDYFLPHIRDYALMGLREDDASSYFEELRNLLFLAIPDHATATVDLEDMNLDLEEFNLNLSLSDKSILGKLMAIAYITPLILDQTLTKQYLNDKDARSYSPAKHLDSLNKIKSELHNEVNRTMSRQSYKIENIKKLFGGKT